jgi:hypothetical protein
MIAKPTEQERETLSTLTDYELSEMRAWVYDCAATEDDYATMRQASDVRILRFVQRQFEGGLQGFIRTL